MSFGGWSGRSGRPTADDVEAMGVGVSAYLPVAMEERPDPTHPDGPVGVVGTCELRPHLLDDGTVSSGLLATVVDSVAGMAGGLASLPDWIVTTNLALRRPAGSAERPGPTELRLTAGVLRRGRNSVVVAVDVDRPDGAAVARAWMTGAILVPAGGPPAIPRPLEPRRFAAPSEPPYQSPPAQFFGLRDGDAPGEVCVDAAPRVRNPWGIVHGGTLAVAADAAARACVAHPTGIDVPAEDLVVTDLVLHYLSPGRVGPIAARGELVGERGGDLLARVSVVDRGADDRPLVLGVATVRRRR